MFEPYFENLFYIKPGLKMLIPNERARDWYSPVEAAWVEELKWTLDNVDLSKGRKVIDGGAHYGLYSICYASMGCDCLAVDLHKNNCAMIEVNSAINNINLSYANCAIAHYDGTVKYNGENLSTILSKGHVEVECRKISTLMPDANVVKLDIEGEEYNVLPEALETMKNVDTWIIEFHLWKFSDIDTAELLNRSLNLLVDNGYELSWIDRSDKNPKVVPYPDNALWRTQSTVIAR